MWTPEKIRDLRKRLGETQAQFSVRLHVSAGCIRNWEQGISKPIGPAEVVFEILEAALKEGKIRELQSA